MFTQWNGTLLLWLLGSGLTTPSSSEYNDPQDYSKYHPVSGSHREAQDGQHVIGEYHLREGKGNVRTVRYILDKNGFHAQVSSSPLNDPHFTTASAANVQRLAKEMREQREGDNNNSQLYQPSDDHTKINTQLPVFSSQPQIILPGDEDTNNNSQHPVNFSHSQQSFQDNTPPSQQNDSFNRNIRSFPINRIMDD